MRGRRWFGLLLLSLVACDGSRAVAPSSPKQPAKVVVFGIPGVSWKDIDRADAPAIDDLIDRGAAGNLAIRVLNRSGEAYATLGAAERAEADYSAGWAFNRDELVENGTAEDLFERRGNTSQQGEIVVVPFEQLLLRNTSRSFEAPLGLLASRLAVRGESAAVLGNADLSRGHHLDILPSAQRMASSEPEPPETDIHREAALAAMSSDGTVALGNVTRTLLEPAAEAPYGLTTSITGLREAFRDVYERASLIVVETGETSRADTYSAGLPEPQREKIRAEGVERASEQIAAVLQEADEQTLVIVFAPTNPGGPIVRGQLRPVIVAGPGIENGMFYSSSTRRDGLITLPDLSALAGRYLGVSDETLGAGRVPKVIRRSNVVAGLITQNSRAATADQIRPVVSIAAVLLLLGMYATVVIWIRRRRITPWMMFLLYAAIAFPICSFASVPLRGEGGPLGGVAAILGTTFGLAGVAFAFGRGRRNPRAGAQLILGIGTTAFFVDLLLGGNLQLDSVLGYSSVAGGRFFGLGNLGFAIFAATALLLAGSIADHKAARVKGDGPKGLLFPIGTYRWAAIGLILACLAWIGAPMLGADIGGVVAMVPAIAVFVYGLSGRTVSRKGLLVTLVLGVLLVLAISALDAARPVTQRTHLGNFAASIFAEPASIWPFIRRKVGLALALAIGNGWGLASIGAGSVLLYLQHRSMATWRDLLRERVALRAAVRAVIVASIVGSLVNDSGIAVAGMMLTITAPWALLMVSSSASFENAGE